MTPFIKTWSGTNQTHCKFKNTCGTCNGKNKKL
jgi:hypothetical protein